MTEHAPLRRAWGLEVDPEDPDGVGPEAVRRASLPPHLSAAFDGARGRIAVPRLGGPGTGAWPGGLPAALQEPWRAAMAAPALASQDEPLPFPLLHQFARFWRDGVRTDYEDEVRRLGILTGEAVLAAVATEDPRWLDRAADGLMLLCELSTWCWVAHEEVHRRRGWVVPDPESPVVDLGAGQTLQVLAWADLALGDALDGRVPGLRERLRREARSRVFEPYLRRRDWFWLHGHAHNWTGWIHQHLIAGALLLLDEEEDRADRDAVLALSIAQLDRYLASFPADGGIDEGYTYFWNGACRLLEAIELLDVASAGVLSGNVGAQVPVIRELLRYPHRMELGEGWYVNVSDGPARPVAPQPWDVLHRWGRRLGEADVLAGALAHRGAEPVPALHPEVGLGRALTAMGDDAWVEGLGSGDSSGVPAALPLPGQSWFPEVELLIAREREGDPRGLTLAAKGGHNAEAHNHLDVGSVMVAVDASPVLIDLGQPTYTARTFGPDRYEIWTMRSSWHTLPTMRGHEQGVGAEHRAEVREAPSGSDPSLTLELAAAYPVEAGVESYRRRVALRRAEPAGPAGAPAADASSPAEVSLHDQWRLETDGRAGEVEQAVAAHHVLAGDVLEHAPGRLLVRTLSGALAELRWDPALGTGGLERRAVEDPLLQQSWGDAVHRLRLNPPTDPETGTGQLTLRIRAGG